jgi:hypothetical protein
LGNEELYDHLHDPEEHVNLVEKQEHQQVLMEMRKHMDAARERARITPDSTLMEPPGVHP